MKYGYARVSLPSQCLDLQIDRLEKEGCDAIFSEKISSRKKDRPELKSLLVKLNEGDTLVCYKLDRLGRSLRELLNLMTTFEEKKVRFISLSDGIDTAKSGSKLLLNIMMCIADFERELIRERTIAGLNAAKNRGVKLGRPIGVLPENKSKIQRIKQLAKTGATPTQIAKQVSLSRPTIYKYMQR